MAAMAEAIGNGLLGNVAQRIRDRLIESIQAITTGAGCPDSPDENGCQISDDEEAAGKVSRSRSGAIEPDRESGWDARTAQEIESPAARRGTSLEKVEKSLAASFDRRREIRELRQLLRHRQSLIEQRGQLHNQIRDLLETANFKLSSVATDLMGVTGRRILKALAAGLDSPEQLSWKARGRLRKKSAEIKEPMKGHASDFFRWMLSSYLNQYEYLSGHITHFEGQIELHMARYAGQIKLLCTITGVDRIVAWSLIAELGVDMNVFPSAAHCASWAGLAPGTHESAGKQRTGRTKRGNQTLRRILTQSAWANARCKDGYLKAFFLRIRARSGWGKAVIATAHKIIVIAYGILKNKVPYQDLGGDYYERMNPERTIRKIQARLAKLGYQAVVSPLENPTS